MSEMFPEASPSPFGPDGPPNSMVEEARRAHALELATDLIAARERSDRSMHATDFVAGQVIAAAKQFEAYLRDGSS